MDIIFDVLTLCCVDGCCSCRVDAAGVYITASRGVPKPYSRNLHHQRACQ